jgi:hypothetical protein
VQVDTSSAMLTALSGEALLLRNRLWDIIFYILGATKDPLRTRVNQRNFN